MKKILLSIAFLVSLQSFGQVTAAKQDSIRKEQEAANKFVSDLVSKTSIKDFQQWMYDNNAGVKDFEVFNKLYQAFIQQKYSVSKQIPNKEQPKK